jgi:hypothetical protein
VNLAKEEIMKCKTPDLKLKNFVSCESKNHKFKSIELNDKEEHSIIYCKNLATIFKVFYELDENVKKITINVPTYDPQLTIIPTYMNLKVNTNIKEIHFNCYTHDFWLHFILDVCPNLEILHFFMLTKEKIKYAAENLEYLKHIYCDYIEDDVEKYYKTLRSSQKDVNQDIKIN